MQDLGDHFMLDQGYTLVWVGWQFDVNPGPNTVKLYAPVLAGVTGKVRTEILVNQKTTTQALPYAPAAWHRVRSRCAIKPKASGLPFRTINGS